MNKVESISVFFHNYYGNDNEWIQYFINELTVPFCLFYNSVYDSFSRVKQSSLLNKHHEPALSSMFSQLIFRSSTNKGKDIGGKLILMDAFLKLGIKSEFILLMHDKHSPYHSNSGQWKKDLLRIAERENLKKIFEIFNKDSKVGIVASQNTIKNEEDNEQKRNVYTDSSFIMDLRNKYNIHPPGLQYVAGTMFWVRSSIFEDFFRQYNPLIIRNELEDGNVTDIEQPTKAHAWERLLSWVVTSKGYQIKGV